MATWEDVRRAATSLPDVDEEPERRWRVRTRPFLFERPLREQDRDALGDDAPVDTPLAAWVPDLETKEALLADDPATYFTTPHFDGYRMVLVHLDRLGTDELTELATDAWLTRAPVTLARRWLADHPDAAPGDPAP